MSLGLIGGVNGQCLCMPSNNNCCNHVLFCMTECLVKSLTAVCSYPSDKSETKEWPYLGCALEFTSAQAPHMVISHSPAFASALVSSSVPNSEISL